MQEQAEPHAGAVSHGAPDFRAWPDDRWMERFADAMAQHRAQIDAIATNPEVPTVANTLEAMERSGQALTQVNLLFTQLDAADSNEARQVVHRDIAPQLAAHQDAILLDQALFARIAALHEQRAALPLDAEQRRLLERQHQRMVRAGAHLDPAARMRLQAINQRLAQLTTAFQEHVRQDTAGFVHWVDDPQQLTGLSDGVRAGARQEAKQRGQALRYAITLQEPVAFEVLARARHRPLREAIYKAYKNRGNRGNAHDNNATIREIVQLRAEAARLLGFATHAHYVLADTMAREPRHAREFLLGLWQPALANAQRELQRLQQQVAADGGDFRIAPWDWWYYAERVHSAEYAFDESKLRPYLELTSVRDGAFLLAQRLWGLTFRRREDLTGYHPDVQIFEVQEADGTPRGLLYLDYLTRAAKRFGAWMTSFQHQSQLLDTAPQISNTANFGPAEDGAPVLLTYEQARILFHEFGHALHGLLSDVRYPSLSGTEVVRDFVELPSQLMENWLTEPEFLRLFARHYQTGEPIPAQLIASLMAARRFNQGFAAVEYLASAFVDLAYHARTADDAPVADCDAFEREVLASLGMPAEILPRHRATHFMHVFADDYSAGYYSYIWAEMLDADAFQAFRERGLFDRELGGRLRDAVLSRGGTVDAMAAYVAFRGREPEREPLLRRRGLLPAEAA